MANGLNEQCLNHNIINLIVIMENMNENIITPTSGNISICTGFITNFNIPPNVTKIIVGIESKNENFNASSLLYPKKRADVVVIPLRLTPGIADSICESPIYNASFIDIFFKVSFFKPILSAM